MKTKAKQLDEGFKPIEITITLENQKELDAFTAYFNFAPYVYSLIELAGWMEEEQLEKIVRPLKKLGACSDINGYQRIENNLKKGN